MKTGQELAKEGASQALDGAGKAWKDEAFDAFCYYGRTFGEFMTEDVSAFAYKHGLDVPKEGRAWGGIVNKALRRKLIKRIGYAPMKTPHCHADPKSVWKWIEGQEQ